MVELDLTSRPRTMKIVKPDHPRPFRGAVWLLLLVVGCWLLVVGCWLLVVGCWLLVVGCWLLVVGCCCCCCCCCWIPIYLIRMGFLPSHGAVLRPSPCEVQWISLDLRGRLDENGHLAMGYHGDSSWDIVRAPEPERLNWSRPRRLNITVCWFTDGKRLKVWDWKVTRSCPVNSVNQSDWDISDAINRLSMTINPQFLLVKSPFFPSLWCESHTHLFQHQRHWFPMG